MAWVGSMGHNFASTNPSKSSHSHYLPIISIYVLTTSLLINTTTVKTFASYLISIEDISFISRLPFKRVKRLRPRNIPAMASKTVPAKKQQGERQRRRKKYYVRYISLC